MIPLPAAGSRETAVVPYRDDPAGRRESESAPSTPAGPNALVGDSIQPLLGGPQRAGILRASPAGEFAMSARNGLSRLAKQIRDAERNYPTHEIIAALKALNGHETSREAHAVLRALVSHIQNEPFYADEKLEEMKTILKNHPVDDRPSQKLLTAISVKRLNQRSAAERRRSAAA